ncbi:hypothetical protein SARC_08486 [Sphaeroforma arctica JP610]|uniref:Uncharacterized protein n=1 Tax=Sphaeroforma arctica JP610 TaxID=667725 RepID=A0A0L0FR08_9EUKA|nr:hypothetical protein SARC_08486 [Sphaeroforma arctica JP610]KNC79119.1 hypothetical protein SARC_08486 [Sphaeroforma arctica JP610]|eukprot:XP_014153021.1 hypothetical protein SARC_08486 [Sphaeroforma arctica JP610]
MPKQTQDVEHKSEMAELVAQHEREVANIIEQHVAEMIALVLREKRKGLIEYSEATIGPDDPFQLTARRHGNQMRYLRSVHKQAQKELRVKHRNIIKAKNAALNLNKTPKKITPTPAPVKEQYSAKSIQSTIDSQLKVTTVNTPIYTSLDGDADETSAAQTVRLLVDQNIATITPVSIDPSLDGDAIDSVTETISIQRTVGCQDISPAIGTPCKQSSTGYTDQRSTAPAIKCAEQGPTTVQRETETSWIRTRNDTPVPVTQTMEGSTVMQQVTHTPTSSRSSSAENPQARVVHGIAPATPIRGMGTKQMHTPNETQTDQVDLITDLSYTSVSGTTPDHARSLVRPVARTSAELTQHWPGRDARVAVDGADIAGKNALSVERKSTGACRASANMVLDQGMRTPERAYANKETRTDESVCMNGGAYATKRQCAEEMGSMCTPVQTRQDSRTRVLRMDGTSFSPPDYVPATQPHRVPIPTTDNTQISRSDCVQILQPHAAHPLPTYSVHTPRQDTEQTPQARDSAYGTSTKVRLQSHLDDPTTPIRYHGNHTFITGPTPGSRGNLNFFTRLPTHAGASTSGGADKQISTVSVNGLSSVGKGVATAAGGLNAVVSSGGMVSEALQNESTAIASDPKAIASMGEKHHVFMDDSRNTEPILWDNSCTTDCIATADPLDIKGFNLASVGANAQPLLIQATVTSSPLTRTRTPNMNTMTPMQFNYYSAMRQQYNSRLQQRCTPPHTNSSTYPPHTRTPTLAELTINHAHPGASRVALTCQSHVSVPANQHDGSAYVACTEDSDEGHTGAETHLAGTGGCASNTRIEATEPRVNRKRDSGVCMDAMGMDSAPQSGWRSDSMHMLQANGSSDLCANSVGVGCVGSGIDTTSQQAVSTKTLGPDAGDEGIVSMEVSAGVGNTIHLSASGSHTQVPVASYTNIQSVECTSTALESPAPVVASGGVHGGVLATPSHSSIVQRLTQASSNSMVCTADSDTHPHSATPPPTTINQLPTLAGHSPDQSGTECTVSICRTNQSPESAVAADWTVEPATTVAAAETNVYEGASMESAELNTHTLELSSAKARLEMRKDSTSACPGLTTANTQVHVHVQPQVVDMTPVSTRTRTRTRTRLENNGAQGMSVVALRNFKVAASNPQANVFPQANVLIVPFWVLEFCF